MSWIKRIFSRGGTTTGADADADLWCSFCHKHRREVRKLISGQQVLICDECIALCVRILDDEAHATLGLGWHVELLLASMTALGARAPYARVRPLLGAAFELARADPALLRRVMQAAIAIQDLDSAVMALRAIPEPARTAVDVLDLAALLTDGGNHDEALAVLAPLAAAELDEIAAIVYQLHDARARLERGGLDDAALTELQARAAELEPRLAALPEGPLEDGLRAARLGVVSLAALASGALDAGERAARARLALRPLDLFTHLNLARVLAARGDLAGARAARDEGRALAHPDGPYVALLEESSSDGPFR